MRIRHQIGADYIEADSVHADVLTAAVEAFYALRAQVFSQRWREQVARETHERRAHVYGLIRQLRELDPMKLAKEFRR